MGHGAPTGDHLNRANRAQHPHQLALDSLVALLKGEALLHQHCYMVHDFQMILRLADEFGYAVAAFHHALEAWKIPDLLHNTTIATWADWWGFKHEAYDGSVHAPYILHENNVKVAIKSDDDVVSRYLMFETAKAVHYRLDPEDIKRETVELNRLSAAQLQPSGGNWRIAGSGEGVEAVDVVCRSSLFLVVLIDLISLAGR